MIRNRSSNTLNKIIRDYLSKHSLLPDNASWSIENSNLGGFGVFAKRDLQPGEVIFVDKAIIIGPRTISTPLCVACYSTSNLRKCRCTLWICSTSCQNSLLHQRECKIIRQWKQGNDEEDASNKLMQCLTPIKALLLSEEDKEIVRNLTAHQGDRHGFEVDILKNQLCLDIKEDEESFLRMVCAVLDANTFEVAIDNPNHSNLKALYSLASLINHRCIPNTYHVFDKNQQMIIKAAVFIPKGSELFISYTKLLWGTITRRYHLYRTKHFLCNCERCSDPTEFGTYMSSVLCKCKGIIVPVKPLKVDKWKCEDCGMFMPSQDVGAILSLLGSSLSCLEDSDLCLVFKFLNNKLIPLVPQHNQVVIQLKYKIIWTLGHSKGYQLKELSYEHLRIKEQFCREVLHLLDILKLGYCRMRGLLLFELYKTLDEMKNRGKHHYEKNAQPIFIENEIGNYFDKAAYILLHDVRAPVELQQNWNSTII